MFDEALQIIAAIIVVGLIIVLVTGAADRAAAVFAGLLGGVAGGRGLERRAVSNAVSLGCLRAPWAGRFFLAIRSRVHWFLPDHPQRSCFEQMARLLEAVERELPKRLGKALRKAYAQQELQFDDPELEQLQSPAAFESWITGLETMTWITRCPEVWDRREVGDGPEAISKVVEYLANYVNRVALSDARILDIEGEQVLFGYKDYRDGDQQKSVWIEGVELIHNFLKHQLPRGMHHIRHYGWMARRAHNDKLEFLREYFAADPQACPEEPAPMPLEEEEATKPCRFCDGVMHQLASTARRPIIPELMAKPLAAFHHAQAGVRVTLGQRLPEIQAQRPADPATRALATEIQRQISDLAVLGFL